MAEQSSTVATFRALVMLICVILIPVAAVCGTSFPAVVKAIQNGRWPTLADFRGPDAANDRSEAPRFASPSASVNPGILPMNAGESQKPAAAGQNFYPSSSTKSSVIAASYNDPGEASTSFPQTHDSRVGLQGGAAANSSGSGASAPAGFERSSQSAQPKDSHSSATEPTSPDALFKRVQDRLRQLGATYYLLEAWGDQKDQYRFYCRMSIGGDPHVFQPFQCIDSDPLAAMSKVLQEVEAWQSRGG